MPHRESKHLHSHIGVEPGTRLAGLARTYYRGQLGWQVWIAVRGSRHALNSTSSHSHMWTGTFLFLCDNGQVLRVQNDGPIDDVWIIRPSDIGD